MKTIQGTPMVIVASDGMMLTQADDVAVENRIVTSRAYLAVNDDAARWREITEAEADAIRAEQQRIMEQRMEDMNR